MISEIKAKKICIQRMNFCDKQIDQGNEPMHYDLIKSYWLKLWDLIDDLLVFLGDEDFNPTMTIVHFWETCNTLNDLGEKEYADQVRTVKILEKARLS